jgi:uncharacterized membrane-anchored protein YitT (DUF2179 family)
VQDWALFLTEIVAGCAIFALGFDLFLEPHSINAGGLSGLAMILVHLLKRGSVGWVTLIANVPLFIIGGKQLGKRFFIGSLVGTIALSGWLEVFELLPAVTTEPLLGAIYGGAICGAGSGLVFLSGASTGGADIIVRLLKKRWRNVPIGKIVLGFDGVVVVLTAIAFQDMTSILYCGITLYLCTQVLDAVVYSFDYSKVALIISKHYEEIAAGVGEKLDRGATYLYGQGVYSGTETKVVLTAVKRQQLADLKEMVVEIDPDAFIIVQESHQVLGDGFIRYTKDSL